MVYFNQLPRDSNEQYSVLVELLVPSSLSSLSTGVINPQQINQLQQQPVLQRTELTFFADKAHKHLSANFKFDRKRLNNYSLDPKQQQYQNPLGRPSWFAFFLSRFFCRDLLQSGQNIHKSKNSSWCNKTM